MATDKAGHSHARRGEEQRKGLRGIQRRRWTSGLLLLTLDAGDDVQEGMALGGRAVRRKVALAVLAVVTLAVGAMIAHLHQIGKRPRCGLDAYNRIRLGMTLAEATAVIGVPPGDYTGGQVRAYRSETEYGQQEFIPPASRKTASHEQWVGARGRIFLGFDEWGKVRGKDFSPMRGGPRCTMLRCVDWVTQRF